MRAQTRRPVVGIIGNSHLINDRYLVHGAGQTNSQAIAEVAGCLPLIVPTDPALADLPDLMAACDGFLFTGGRPNVHPSEYGEEETPAHGSFDRGRDGVALALVSRGASRSWGSAVAFKRSMWRWAARCTPRSAIFPAG